jgi:hypothetical protein
LQLRSAKDWMRTEENSSILYKSVPRPRERGKFLFVFGALFHAVYAFGANFELPLIVILIIVFSRCASI